MSAIDMIITGFFYSLGGVFAVLIGLILFSVIGAIGQALSGGSKKEEDKQMNLGEITEDELFSEEFNKKLRENLNDRMKQEK